MNKVNQVVYTDEPIQLGEEVPNFLPSPDKLVFKTSKTIKVSLVLDKTSVDFFKSEAKRLNASYQRMIRNLLQEYVQKMKSQSK